VEAGRRARGRLRRYCAANRLNKLGTLTYAGSGVFEPRQVRADVALFFRSLREDLGGQPFPYVWVPEWHKSHGLHLHFAVGQFIQRSRIEQAWGRGFVNIKLIGDLAVGSGVRHEARKAAGYLSKYVAKTFQDHEHPTGLHRYEVAQGFQPQVEKLTATTLDDLLELADHRMGARPVHTWFSRDVLDWQGPPAFWRAW
jgi:hypothetical protein